MEWRGRLQNWKLHRVAWNGTPRRIGEATRRWASGCADLLFPPVCLLCGTATPGGDSRFCHDCQRALTDNGAARCSRCAKPLPKYSRDDPSGCALCRNKRWRFQRAIALGTYGGEVRKLVLQMKQARNEPLCLAAGELLADTILRSTAGECPDLVAPVPMHWFRKLVRGMNDSEVLAEAVASHLQVPVSMRMLRCLRPTQKQGTLAPAERRMNVRGAFGVRRRAGLAESHVLVVDDVMTTGATANELARVLRNAGAAQVTIAIVARGIGFD